MFHFFSIFFCSLHEFVYRVSVYIEDIMSTHIHNIQEMYKNEHNMKHTLPSITEMCSGNFLLNIV